MSLVFAVADVAPDPVKSTPFDYASVLPGSPGPLSKKPVEPAPAPDVIGTSLTFGDPRNGCGFVRTALLAYNQHHRLVLRPDDVWLAVVTQFASYVQARSEELRDRFVDFGGKRQLVVRGLGTLRTADYARFTEKMADQIARNVRDPLVREWIVPNFSTTTATDRVVGAAALMSTLKNYFDYKFCLMCGVPEVELLGTPDDWDDLVLRVDFLTEFDLAKEKLMTRWLQLLKPVVSQMAADRRSGSPDVSWWNRMCHYLGGGSGPTYVSGWITAFCVFSDKGKWQGGLTTAEKPWPPVNTSDLPRGYLSVPIVIDDNGEEHACELYAGHLAKSVPSANTVAPRLDWFLVRVGP